MLKKLKSVLKEPASLSTFKAVIFSILLILAVNHWLFAVIFVLAALFFYFSGQSGNFFYSFLILLASSLIIVKWLSQWSVVSIQWSAVFGAVVFGVLFFILSAIKNLFFINKENYYHFLNNFLFFLVFLIFFQIDKARFFWLQYLVLFLAVFALFKEPLIQRDYFLGGQAKANFPINLQKINLLASGLAFIIIQYAWAVSLLPIGFLNATALMTVGALILKDLLSNYLNGLLSRRIVLKNITLFIISSLIVFVASIWQP